MPGCVKTSRKSENTASATQNLHMVNTAKSSKQTQVRVVFTHMYALQNTCSVWKNIENNQENLYIMNAIAPTHLHRL